jgi:hypothetical protein
MKETIGRGESLFREISERKRLTQSIRLKENKIRRDYFR